MMTLPETSKPVLVYDGDCSICQEWVDYWHKFTGDTVHYRPYQQVADNYPDISIESFKQSIQYLEPDGHKSTGAEACFRLLRQQSGTRFIYWCYRHLPGFSNLSELAYRFFSQHRKLLAWLCHLFWGKNFEPARYEIITWIFLRSLGLIYFAAFISFSTQVLGLIGSQGIVPIELYLEKALDHFGSAAYLKLPTLFWIDASDTVLRGTCLAGVLFSIAIIFNIYLRTSLFLAYLFYLSLFYAGQAFMTFQWDLLLLEAGFLALFLPTRSHIIVWLYRWLAFKFMFLGGVVKIISRDPTWDNLTALSYHFETQPLPSPLAWHFHHFPDTWLMTMTAATLVIELIIPFLVFFPRRFRFIAAFMFIGFQLFIILTGNYNFFNLLAIAFCLFLFDDAAIRWLLPGKITNKLEGTTTINPVPLKNSIIAAGMALLVIVISTTQFTRIFTGNNLPVGAALTNVFNPFNIINTYGPFAIMTTRRVEISIEGSNNKTDWKEYKFKYKPDNLKKPLRWIIPHQPRLDWQMWFAALKNHKQSPWFANVLYRLLQGSPEVIKLFKHNPFPGNPPTYIRATAYVYKFSDRDTKQRTRQVWEKEILGNYFPITHLPDNGNN